MPSVNGERVPILPRGTPIQIEVTEAEKTTDRLVEKTQAIDRKRYRYPSGDDFHQKNLKSGDAVRKVDVVVSGRDRGELLFNVDTIHFELKDITVTLYPPSCLFIRGEQVEDIDAHGLVSRQFKRRYVIPDDIDAETIRATFDSRKILSIYGEKRMLLVNGKSGRNVKIDSVPARKIIDYYLD